MANLGIFDPELRVAAWFDPQLVTEGWFDPELIGQAGIALFEDGVAFQSITTTRLITA